MKKSSFYLMGGGETLFLNYSTKRNQFSLNPSVAKLCLLLIAPFCSFGQTTAPLFAVIPTEMATLNTEQQTRWNRLSSEQYDVKKIVSIGNLPDYINSGGLLQIDLPDDACGSVSFQSETVELGADGDYYYYAFLSSGGTTCACDDGYFMLQKENGAVFGEIMIAEDIFQIVNLTGGLSAYVRADTTFLEGRICGMEEEPAPQVPEESTQAVANDRSSSVMCNIVRIVFFYTANAADECDPEETATQCISEANQALINSGVPQTTLKFVKAGVYPSSMTESGFANTDLNTFGPIAVAACSTYYADVAVLFTDGYETIAGITPAGNIGSPSASTAYTLVEIKDAITQKTFAHEIAHVMGCDHQLCILQNSNNCSSTTTAINHGYKINYGGIFGSSVFEKLRLTLMHELGDGGFKAKKRLLVYSNPLVIHLPSGIPLGNATANNASWFGGIACTVSSFQPDPPPPFIANILPDDWLPDPGQTVGLESVISGGTAPFTYSWSYSSGNPFSYGSPFSTNWNTTFTIPNPCPGCFFFIRLVVTDSQAKTATAIHKIKTPLQFSSGCNTSSYSSGENELTFDIIHKSEQEDFAFSPNPVTSQLGIKFQNSADASILDMEVVDIEGKVLFSKRFQLEYAGVFETNLDMSAIPNGTHFIRLTSNGETFTKSIIVLKP